MDVALASSVWVTSPEFAGWLGKRGFHWRKLWKKRWVALHGAEIVYMDKEPTLENSSNLAMTKAQITSATVIDRDDIDGNVNGFAIHVNDGHSPTWYLRADSSRDKKAWLMRLAHVHAIVRWLEDFEKVRVLGVGGTGIVYELLHKTNGQRYAMKEMEIKNKAQMQMAISEAEMLKDIMENISHPNIMHIEKVFQVGSKFYLVFPLCTGGELYEHIIRRGQFTEHDAAVLMRDLISGLHALHSHNILHLDIKPENILFDSNREDAKIKITDFGLSKVFSSVHEDIDKVPSKEELEDRLRQFSESGVLNRDALRGTVGYMSPELILAGHSSKATDVFAAGVVLFILLCGHPPFYSKSNREVLERTAKGQYRLDDAQWEDISDEAKDLVRKMLTVNPSDRISTSDILKHPWMDIERDNDPEGEKFESAAQAIAVINQAHAQSGGISAKRMFTGPRKGSGVNLTGALRLLSGHVSKLRSEKLAASFTRLVSSLQSGNTKESILTSLLKPIDESNQFDLQLKEEDTMMLMNPDIKDALASAINKIGEETGKLSLEQFMSILRLFGIGPPTTSSSAQSAAHGLPLMLLCRFIDRDGDGFISADDIFTTQALVAQRSDVFIRAIFRIYSEAIWYPGRQLNLMHLQRTPKKGTSGTSKVLEENLHLDVVEPPKFITGRHVAAVFEKMGFEATGGHTIFTTLCEALARANNTQQRLRAGSTAGTQACDDERDSLANPVMSPQAHLQVLAASASTGAALSSTINRDRAHSTALPTPPPSTVTSPVSPNAALSAAFGGLALGGNNNTNHHTLSTINEASAPSTPGRDSISSPDSPARRASNPQDMASAAAASSSSSGGGGNSKMDVNDFLRAVEMDDILISALLMRPRFKMIELLKKADTVYRDDLLSNPNVLPTGDSSASSSRTSVLEEELLSAMRGCASNKPNVDNRPSFPIAKAMGRATWSAAFGLAAKVTIGAQVLMEATYENMEGGYTGAGHGEGEGGEGRGDFDRDDDSDHLPSGYEPQGTGAFTSVEEND